MRIVFMGTPDFAVPCLEALIKAEHQVVGVFTQPDKPVGRKQILTTPEVKACALKYEIPVYQPEKIKGSNAVEIINELKPDVIIVVAYGKILPKEILTSAPFGCINVHASLLPLYRGAAPIQWAVLNGDKKTGVTVMQMDEGLDTGDILSMVETTIGENETSAELFDRLSVMGANALIDTLENVEAGTAVRTKQPQADTQYASMIDKSMCPINWNDDAQKIHNQVRGLQTWPVATTMINSKQFKIHKTLLTDITSDKKGEIVDNNSRLIVACGDGRCLEICELQAEGKKRMTANAYLQGHKLEIGTKMGE
ncbi:methionyl-tRNA formyltransferase [uncultured Eubacterium sp.]|uniref:methionyl-tRNA formyltransferase n=1 Tax=uncultured Eubacterium sp. TaxID=165185 RepID=UPI0015B220F9|nr:methionyl-tRNA formyltransferase [uncultured Eubacterium sp.]